MVYGMYAIRDKETGFMSPIVDASDGAAKRNFSRAVNGLEGVIPYSPADFDLFRIAEFDSEKGEVKPISPIVFVVNGAFLIGAKDEK